MLDQVPLTPAWSGCGKLAASGKSPWSQTSSVVIPVKLISCVPKTSIVNICDETKHPSAGWLSITKLYVCVSSPLSTIDHIPDTPVWSGCGKLAASGKSAISHTSSNGRLLKLTSKDPLTSISNGEILTKHASTGWLSITKLYVCVPSPLSTLIQVPVTPAWSGCGKLTTFGKSDISQTTLEGKSVKLISTSSLIAIVKGAVSIKHPSAGWLSITKLYVCVSSPLSTIDHIPDTPVWSGCGKLVISGKSEASQTSSVGNAVKLISISPLTAIVKGIDSTKHSFAGWLSIIKL